MISKQRQNLEASGASPSTGLGEQFEIQLKILESNNGADIEIAHLPFFTSNVGMLSECDLKIEDLW